MKVGYKKLSICPSSSKVLGGYAVENRYSTGINDDIYCRTLIINNDDELFCFVSFDVLCVGEGFVSKIRNAANKYGIIKENVMVSAIHTHSAPVGLCNVHGLELVFGEGDEDYINQCICVFKDCLDESLNNMKDSKVKISYKYIDEVVSERHSIDNWYDRKLTLIEFDLNIEKILLYNYSCHPTILHEDNTLISADFIGEVNRLLEGKYSFTMFINGSAGDISTRFTRKKSGFEEVIRLGKDFVEKLINNDEVVIYEGNSLDLIIERKIVELKTFEKEHVNELENNYRTKNDIESYNNYLFSNTIYKNKNSTIHLEVNKIKLIDNLYIVTIPSEITSSLTKELLLTNEYLIFSYTNGYNLYISDINSYNNHFYESSTTYLEKGEGERLIEVIKNIKL